jgi:Cu+-exporting ATPase
VVVFDKTGTLTQGRPEVMAVVPVEGSEEALLGEVAAVQRGSEHILGRAIVREAQARQLPIAEATSFRTRAGLGVEARVGGALLVVGSARLMQERGVDFAAQRDRIASLEAEGHTVIYVARHNVPAGMIALGDAPRQHAAEAVARLRASGVDAVMLTGDTERAARQVADHVGITRVVAGVLPGQKADEVRALRNGRKVAMVGDGINDAPALAAADIGFAMGSGTDLAMHAAGVTLMRPDPRLVADAISISRATVRKIRQNLFWAFIYNVIGLPLAALGFLSPVLAGGAMALSSVSVVTNALLLRRWRPGARRSSARRSEPGRSGTDSQRGMSCKRPIAYKE